ncbi:MAG: alanine dehydrogenase [candidate division Zixibacteria bacterium]|nr:alanine dehydrogenase [Gammaproteobacteria bacterium]NIX55841.1 alanine dehydrogenase [candidate division Zixibacteria bacterium]
MNIGIPKESRPSEYRVGLSPSGVQRLTSRGHTCYLEHDAGKFAGFSDHDYENAGAKIVYSSHEAFARADFIIKVARPQEEELDLIRPGSIVSGWLHLPAASQTKIETLLKKKITTIAYEQIQREDGTRPVLQMMSQIAGKMLPQIAAYLLQNNNGGKGILLGGIAGIPPAEVVIIGAGVLGQSAVQAFYGLGAHITLLDISVEKLQTTLNNYPNIATMYATKANIQRTCAYGDVIVTAAAIPGRTAPKIITRDILRTMKPRSIIMDGSIDQGGCLETSRPTTHDNPTFIEEGVIHYCVPNISSLIARTASNAFSNVAYKYFSDIIENGIGQAIKSNPEIARAVNTHEGQIKNLERLSETFGQG